MSKFRLAGRRTAGSVAAVVVAGGLIAATGAAQQAQAATSSPAAVTSASGQANPAVPIAAAPVFTADRPPLRASQGEVYRYHFAANGRPFPTYLLVGAPRWLSINRTTGLVSGRVPLGTQQFRYAVAAVNSVGTAQTRTFVVTAPRLLPQTIRLIAPRAGEVGKAAVLTAIGGRSGRPVTLSVDRLSGRGVCLVAGHTVRYLRPGVCVIDANQAGTSGYAPAPQVRASIQVGSAPRFVAASPARLATAGTVYAYRFVAAGAPAPRLTLVSGPAWLRLNPVTGQLSGVVPRVTRSFRYSVTAVNAFGRTTVAYTVVVR